MHCTQHTERAELNDNNSVRILLRMLEGPTLLEIEATLMFVYKKTASLAIGLTYLNTSNTFLVSRHRGNKAMWLRVWTLVSGSLGLSPSSTIY